MNSLGKKFDAMLIVEIPSDKKKYNAMEPALQEIQKAIALPSSEKTQHNCIMQQVLDQIIGEMKLVDSLFKNIYNKKLYGGSYYDGLKLHSPDEYDLDLALKLPKKIVTCLTISEIAGFVKIHVDLDEMKGDASYKDYRAMEKFIDSNNYLLTNKFREWFEGVFNKAKNNMQNGNNKYKFELSKSGPAMTLKIQIDGKLVCVDLVPSFIFGKNEWPGSPFRENPANNQEEFLVVPKDPKTTTTYTSWRLSFQEQERKVINGKNGLKDTIRLLKLLRNRQFNESSFASYYIKTVMMWFNESVDDSYWNNSRSCIFMMGLKYFSKLMKEKKIPYYWNKEYNLLDGMKDVTLSNMSNRIDRIIITLEKQLDSPNLRSTVIDYFGLDKLKEKSGEEIRKDIEEGTECLLNSEYDDRSENSKVWIIRKAVNVLNEAPSRNILIDSIPSTSINIPKDAKGDTSVRTPELEHTKEIIGNTRRTLTEYEAIGINVTRKLERMDTNQALYAEKLITEILIKGCLKQLSSETDIS